MKKLLIYVVTYNHEDFIEKTLSRIDESLFDNYETEILVNDDSSKDDTLRILMKIKKNFNKKVQFTILSNPKNLGYGGNQKIGYFYAIKHNFDYVVLLHGDGQYKPEIMGDLLEILESSRMSATVFSGDLISPDHPQLHDPIVPRNHYDNISTA